MSDVPEEIWGDILSRLPVAPLLRFRSVSKSWKSLIDSDEFIKQHLEHSKKTNTKLGIILTGGGLYSADFDILNQTNRANFQELTHPLGLEAPFDGTHILDSCDGLLVLLNYERRNTILWNPSVRRFHELPSEGFEFLSVIYISYGFGYDVASDDFKLVRMVQAFGDDSFFADIQVKVYSLKSDSWRRIPDIPYYLKHRSIRGEFANGSLHWIVGRKVNPHTVSLIIAFDLGTEEYRLVPLPEFAGDDPCMNMFVLGGCLSLMFYVNDNVDIWVMKEYGVQESWSFSFTFDNSDFNFRTPLAYSKCNRKVLVGLEDRILMWYDLDKKSTDFPMVPMPSEDSYDMYTCLQSLVLLNNGTCDFDLVTKKKQERKDKERSCRTRNDSLKNGEIVFPPNGHDLEERHHKVCMNAEENEQPRRKSPLHFVSRSIMQNLSCLKCHFDD